MATMYMKDILRHVFGYDDTVTEDIVEGKVLSNKKLHKASSALTVFAIIISCGFPVLHHSAVNGIYLLKLQVYLHILASQLLYSS